MPVNFADRLVMNVKSCSLSLIAYFWEAVDNILGVQEKDGEFMSHEQALDGMRLAGDLGSPDSEEEEEALPPVTTQAYSPS